MWHTTDQPGPQGPYVQPEYNLVEMPEQTCLIKAFFAAEQKKPPNQRAQSCNISCPCPLCTPRC